MWNVISRDGKSTLKRGKKLHTCVSSNIEEGNLSVVTKKYWETLEAEAKNPKTFGYQVREKAEVEARSLATS